MNSNSFFNRSPISDQLVSNNSLQASDGESLQDKATITRSFVSITPNRSVKTEVKFCMNADSDSSSSSDSDTDSDSDACQAVCGAKNYVMYSSKSTFSTSDPKMIQQMLSQISASANSPMLINRSVSSRIVEVKSSGELSDIDKAAIELSASNICTNLKDNIHVDAVHTSVSKSD